MKEVDKYSELRKKAQLVLKESGEIFSPNKEIDIRELIEEFTINQIELELQNEELIQIRNKLEASQQYLNNLFTHAPVGYIVLNSDGNIQEINQTAAHYFDIPPYGLKGHRFQSFIPHTHLIEYMECINRLNKQKEPQQMKICFKIKTGHHFWAKADFQILDPPIMPERCMLCTLTDITQEKEYEEGLKQIKDSLEEAVRIRTEELMKINAKLQEEIKIKEEIDRHRKEVEADLIKAKKFESVGMLAGGIAHDFNNLLSVILGNIELAKEDRCQRNFEKFLNNAIEACFKGKELTGRLITFSKGGMPVKKVGELSEVIIESCRFATAGSNVKCVWDIPDDLWKVEFDEYQLRQALSNIILNATESMPNGGIVLISATNEIIQLPNHIPSNIKEHRYVHLKIIDNGKGIPEEILPFIFDPYFSTKERGSEKGMGLGLSIAYSIITKHNGTIFAESTLGKGTTIHVRLPAYLQVPEISTDTSIKVSKQPPVKRKRILVMDDEPMLREFIEKLLIHLGYEAVLAKDGQETIEKYRKAIESNEPIYAVILDLTVRGGMGGKETIIKLKEIDPNVVAIVSSGYSKDPVMENYKFYGFAGALPKPYQKKDLKLLLENL